MGISVHHQRRIGPLEGRCGANRRCPRIRAAMNHKALAHARHHRPAINVPQVAPAACPACGGWCGARSLGRHGLVREEPPKDPVHCRLNQ